MYIEKSPLKLELLGNCLTLFLGPGKGGRPKVLLNLFKPCGIFCPRPFVNSAPGLGE